MKKCCGCGKVKLLDQFPKAKQLKSGAYSHCLVCMRWKFHKWYYSSSGKKYKEKNKDKIDLNQIKYRHSKKGKKIARMGEERSIKKYPEKREAREKLRMALRYRKIKRSPCFCGDKKVEGHHKDYSKPLDVVWLCRKHHQKMHTKMKMTCKKCNYEWTNRLKNPRSCPNCHSYRYLEDKSKGKSE